MTIAIQNLRVDYRGRQGCLNIIDIPCWTVAKGEQIAVFGPSGSGKSTLLHVLSGVITATEGRVEVCGTNLTTLTELQRDRFRARSVGYVFQNLNLLSGYTALENVLMGATFSPERSDRRAAESLLHTVGLADRMHHSPRQMSLGEQQRVAIARALIKRPELVLADEPTGSLDPRNTSQIVRLLRTVCEARQSTLILVTHEQSVLSEFEQRLSYTELNRAWHDIEVEA
jgi:ABC-type lipoprotein export system ATPase subunit